MKANATLRSAPDLTNDPACLSADTLVRALDASRDAIVITDHTCKIRHANVASVNLIGLEPLEIQHASLLAHCEFLAEDLKTSFALPIDRVVASGIAFRNSHPINFKTQIGVYPVDLTISSSGDELIWTIIPLSVTDEIKRQVVLQAKLLDHISESVIAADINANVVYWNHAAEKLYGWTAEEALGKNVYQLIIPEHNRKEAWEGFNRWQDDLPREGESNELRKDGTHFPSYTRISIVRNAQGEKIGFVGVARDLTMEKEAQQSLSQSVSLLNAALQSTAEGVLAVDMEGRITTWNEQFVRLWNLPEEIVRSGDDDRAIAAVLDQLADPDHFLEKLRYLYSRPEEESFDTIQFKDGRIFERSSKPQRVNGEPVGRVWSFRDVTDLYKVQEQLRDQTSLYKSMLDTQSDMGEGLAIATPTKVLHVNAAICAITGYSEHELYELNDITHVLRLEDRVELGTRLAKRMRGEEVPTHYEAMIQHKSGKHVDVELAVKRREAPHHGEIVVIMRDISERKEIERNLRASELRFGTVMDNLGEALAITDTEDRILYMNSKLEEISGYSFEECLGQNGPALMTLPVEHTLNAERLKRRLEGQPDHYEVLLRKRNGSLRWCSVNAVPYFDHNGKIIGTVAAITDIHNQKQRELELKRVDERFRYMTLATSDAVWDWSLDTNTVWWNDAFGELFGHELQDSKLSLETWANWVHPDDYDRVTKGLSSALAQGKQTWRDEYRFLRRDGSYAFVIDRGYILLDENNHPYRMIGAMMDVTDRKRAEDELKMAAANTSALIENTSDAILSIDRELRLVTFNTSFYERFCLHNAHPPYPGLSLREFLDPHELDLWDGIFARALRGEHFTVERRRYAAGLGERFFEMSFNPIVEGGSIVGIAIFDKDITERKLMELQLIDAKEKAEEMSRLKSSFLANMSHEIRTPMTAILGFASIIRESSDSDELNEYANTIERSGTRLLSTINGILDLAKIESNKIEVRLQPLDSRLEVEKAVKFFQPLARNKGLKLVQISSCDCTINVDEQYLSQILNNLIGNAIKFTKNGSVTVEASYSDHDNTCAISVRDTGVGISEDFLPYIFDEFKQESGGYDRSFEGTGLGLTITKRLCEIMGATITVESELGVGSQFTINFPVVRTDAVPSTIQFDSLSFMSSNGTANTSLPRVLLVEDGKETVKLVDIFLRTTYNLDFASSADSAIEKAKSNQYDLVLMDVNLGQGASGLDVTAELRKDPKYAFTPIIALTAYAMKGDRESAIAAGCSDYLSKPFSKVELTEKLQEYLKS